MLTTSELGALLAAVGNHEAKALTYVAMEPGEAYGVSALHRLFLDIQGDDPVFVGTVNLQQKYCLYSFELAGLVYRTEKRARVLAVLRGHDGVTTEDITAHLSPDLNTPLVRGTLSQLAKDGHVRGEKQSDGPYKRWYLT